METAAPIHEFCNDYNGNHHSASRSAFTSGRCDDYTGLDGDEDGGGISASQLLLRSEGKEKMHQQYDVEGLIRFAEFLRKELPIRLAHRIQDLDQVPYLSEMTSVISVKSCYIDSFRAITAHPEIRSEVDESSFASLLHELYQNHSGVLINMARGAFQLRKHQALFHSNDFSRVDDDIKCIHAFLDRFHSCRIGIRVLAGQYLALRSKPISHTYSGMIDRRTSPYQIVRQAIDDATFMCARKYGDAPEVIIKGRLGLTFPYIPSHLHYILLELLKNSMRATVDAHGTNFPPIQVVIADGDENEDVTIKVSDEGGGIPRSHMARVWDYLFTTADPAVQEAFCHAAANNHVDHGIDSPLAGLGYGLPISRSYARYFGGDLGMMSMEGFGTDAFVHLVRLNNSSSRTAELTV